MEIPLFPAKTEAGNGGILFIFKECLEKESDIC